MASNNCKFPFHGELKGQGHEHQQYKTNDKSTSGPYKFLSNVDTGANETTTVVHPYTKQ